MSTSDNLLQPSDDATAAPSGERPRRAGRRVLSGLLLVAAILVLVHQPLLSGFARRFRVDDPAPADAIVLLMGDRDGDRPIKAAELYRQGLAPVILMGTSFPSTDRYKETLRQHGVPAGAIRIMPEEVRSTRDEALSTRKALRSLGPVHRIIVVTTSFHTARSRWMFRKVLGPGIEVRSAASREPRFDESNWYTAAIGVDTYLRESIKTVYYRLAY